MVATLHMIFEVHDYLFYFYSDPIVLIAVLARLRIGTKPLPEAMVNISLTMLNHFLCVSRWLTGQSFKYS